MTDEYEVELDTSREEVATILHGIADGVAAGALRLGEGDDERTVTVPELLSVAVEFEEEDDDSELEVELAWLGAGTERESATADADAPEEGEGVPTEEPGPQSPDVVPGRDELEDTEGIAEPAGGDAAQRVSLGRFELFEDRNGEWRWRLIHRNGNVIATSGEGYTRKHNARKGLRSVMRNAEGAEVTERPDE